MQKIQKKKLSPMKKNLRRKLRITNNHGVFR